MAELKDYSLKFTWDCLQGKQYSKDGQTWSETFYSPKNDAIKWALSYSNSYDSCGNIMVWLSLQSSNTFPVVIESYVELLEPDRPPEGFDSKSQYTTVNEAKNVAVGWGKKPKSMCINIQVSAQKSLSDLALDLFAIQDNGQWSDLSLFVEDKKLKVHKVIVGARSPVLAAILDEKPSSDEIHIPDVDLDTMQIVVDYMYTDYVDDIDGVALQIYPVACEYQLLSLKALCEETFRKD